MINLNKKENHIHRAFFTSFFKKPSTLYNKHVVRSIDDTVTYVSRLNFYQECELTEVLFSFSFFLDIYYAVFGYAHGHLR